MIVRIRTIRHCTDIRRIVQTVYQPIFQTVMPRADGIIDWKIDCYVILFFDYQTVVVQLNMMGKRKGGAVEYDNYCSHYVSITIIQTIQIPIIILKLFRIIVTKESDFIKAYTIRVFLILLYNRNVSFVILFIVMQFGHIFTNCP